MQSAMEVLYLVNLYLVKMCIFVLFKDKIIEICVVILLNTTLNRLIKTENIKIKNKSEGCLC